MRDDEGGAPRHQRRQRLLHPCFSRGIQSACRLIQNQHGRILQQGTRNGQALALPAGKGAATLTNHRVITMGLALDEIMRFRKPAGMFQFFLRCIGAPDHQVFADGAVEQHAFLEHDADVAAQAFQ